tara:strand:+ start:127 stop:468 length:342 start_codon:yes stop_codon:yes gene_type:complete
MPAEEQRDRTMDAEFIEAIRNDTPVAPDFAEGVHYMEFCEAVAQSIYEGRTISMPPEPKMVSWGGLSALSRDNVVKSPQTLPTEVTKTCPTRGSARSNIRILRPTSTWVAQLW